MNKEHTTIYKGLAILSVILSHAAGTFGQGRFVLFTPLGGIGVAIFLLLSAYGLNESWNKPENAGGGYYLVAQKIHHSMDSLHYCSTDSLLAFP